VLVYTEQGYGDAIQFVRYVPALAELGATVILESQSSLTRLFQTVEGVKEVIARGEALPVFDFHIALLSLPGNFNTNLETIPRRVPYLSVPQDLAHSVVLPAIPNKAKIGLVWAGNPQHLNDRNRSLSVEILKPLIDSAAAEFFSLQIGERALEWRLLRGSQADATDLTNGIRDYADTAVRVQQLDLVISVDTSVAHLAGALGKPIWLLLPFAPDWRWLLNREDSPWYPTMRLFRQARPGGWPLIVQRVIDSLRSDGGRCTPG
jgi:hypothetical protein